MSDYFSKELGLGIVSLVAGSFNVAMFLKGQNQDPTIGIMLLALSIFWLNGGIGGHGTL